MESAIRALCAAGIPLCTLNYDHLLERVTDLPAIKLGETDQVVAWMRMRREGAGAGILHLHGSWDAPATCILGIRDYETTLGNDVRDLYQRSLASFSRLLFIGCGDTFADPNFSSLIKWLREKMKTAPPEHYALVSKAQVADRHADPAWQVACASGCHRERGILFVECHKLHSMTTPVGPVAPLLPAIRPLSTTSLFGLWMVKSPAGGNPVQMGSGKQHCWHASVAA